MHPGTAPTPRLDHHERAIKALARVGEVLGRSAPPAAGRQLTDQLLLTALGRAWRDIISWLASDRADLDDTRRCVDLLDEIRACEEMFRRIADGRAVCTQRKVRAALAELHGLTSIEELVAAVPAVAGRMGFDRVLLSRVEDSVWIPESMFVDHSPAWAEDIVEAGRQHLRRLDDALLEYQIVSHNRPLLVHEVAGRSHLHRELVNASKTCSYVAAPITVGDRVIGLLHADRYWEQQRAQLRDRELLWLFTEGLAHVISGIAAVEALTRLRDDLDHLVPRAEVRSSDSAASPALLEVVQLPPHVLGGVVPSGSLPPVSTSGPPNSLLTRRETDVIALMGQGCTNGQIARRLIISEGTVKSHVKKILAKMRASNRAEAVAVWLRDQTPGPGTAAVDRHTHVRADS